MPLHLTGQAPQVLSPAITLPLTGDYDPMPYVRSAMVDPFFVPMPGHQVSLADGQGHDVDADRLFDLVAASLSSVMDPALDADLHSLYHQGLIHYDASPTVPSGEVFAIQAAAKAKLPGPSPRVSYTGGSDVQPSAKALIAAPGELSEAAFFASLAYTYAPETLGFWFISTSAYDDFRAWATSQVSALTPVLPQDTAALMGKFLALRLTDLTESLVLRKDDDDALEEYSFARVAVHLLTAYAAGPGSGTNPAGTVAGIMAFNAGELFCPRTVVLVNAEKHARASARAIDAEWNLINACLAAPVKQVSLNQISRLTALPRAAAKAAAAAANASSNKMTQLGRAARVRLRKQPPNRVDIRRDLLTVLKRMKQVNRSQNAIRQIRSTYLKANRRNSDDFNLAGKIASTKYLPDLHVYLDTSGSISEANYQSSVQMLIALARAMDVNLYFNSFSHVLSQEVLLKTKGKSVGEVYRQFQAIPKVTGGTDFEQIWKYINASPVRRRRLSLVVTDFGWAARSQRVAHPRNLYYAPCSDMDWDLITGYADGFIKSVRHIEPAIAAHLIGMVRS